MNQKSYVNIILVLIILLLGVVAYFAHVRKIETLPVVQTPSLTPELTKETALSLMKDVWVMECRSEGAPGEYGSCTIDISKEKDHWVVVMTYDGLFDDSVSAMRFITIVNYEDGQWVKGEVSQTQRCWPNRGHQDFSTELCI